MFVGHYGVSFAVKRVEPSIPLWVLFLAVQLLDVLWAPFVLLGIEKVRIVPGITASNPLDLYYMPYTHGLAAALLWSAGACLVYRLLGPRATWRAGGLVALAVFSHWILDLLVHRPDLPLFDDTAKVGFGLWNYPAPAFALEAACLFGGIWLYLKTAPAPRAPMLIFGVVMLTVHAAAAFGPPPPSATAAAWTALFGYAVFAAVVARLERPAPQPVGSAPHPG
jgi:hypothetical protein